jgi:Uma2 family endonuclease
MSRLLLSVEVLSRRTRRVDREIKRPLYLREGIREYWIIDTRVRTFHVWRPGALTAEVLRESLTWRPVPDADPLVIDLLEYFREVVGSA